LTRFVEVAEGSTIGDLVARLAELHGGHLLTQLLDDSRRNLRAWCGGTGQRYSSAEPRPRGWGWGYGVHPNSPRRWLATE
jgi:hypothetical protein